MDSKQVVEVFRQVTDDETLQCLIDTEIMLEILENRRRHLVKVLEAKVDARRNSKVQ